MPACDHTGPRACAPGLRLLPAPSFPDIAQARHLRQQLAAAAEHGIAMLEALSLPRLVAPGAEPLDPAAIGEAVDRAIAALDEADAGAEDLEEGGDDEPALGWPERLVQSHLADGFGEDEDTLGWTAAVSQLDLGPNTEDGEHSLGAPERHPYVASMTSRWFEPAAGRRTMRDGAGHSQVSWAQGERRDGEGEAEPGYDLACDDDERDDDRVDAEPSIGWPEDFTAAMDPTRQSEGNGDCEADPLDRITIRRLGPEGYVARQHAQGLGRQLAHRARAIRRGERIPEKPTGELVPVALTVVAIGGRSSLVGWRL